jgi:replicative DNA helicase
MSKKPREKLATRSMPPDTGRNAEGAAITDTGGSPTPIDEALRSAFQNGRVPPHDLGAERAVLSAMLLSREALDQMLEILKPEHFYSDANGHIYEAALALARSGTPVDIVSVASYLRDRDKLSQIGGATYLAQLADATPALAQVGAHAQVIYEKWRLRALITTFQRTADKAYGDVAQVQDFIDGAEQEIYELARTATSDSAQPFAQVLRAAFQQITAAAERGDRITGISTGYEKLDAKTAGLHPGDLIVIASRPGMGKSGFALNVGVNVASPRTVSVPGPGEASHGTERSEPGFGVAVFSLEMPREQLATRMVCSEGRVDLGRLRQGYLPPDDWRRLSEAASYLSSLPIWIDRAYDVAEMRAKVRRIQAEYNREATPTSTERKVGLVIVDPVQLLESDPRRQNREEETADAARALKRMALDLDVTVMALSQLSRAVETRFTKDKRPQLSDLRDSGAIEDAADAVIFIYRDEYYNPETTNARGIAELIIAKQRNGPTGKVLTRFTASCTRFDNLAAGDYPEMEDE